MAPSERPPLILVRHGESTWNRENRFTGWVDVPLTDSGRREAVEAGRTISDAGLRPEVVHTSVLVRAIQTADTLLEAMGLAWLPVRRSWRLNERHYGGLTGLNKAETAERYGDEQVKVWRRSYATPPPALAVSDERHPSHDPRYADLPPELLPATECLADVVERMLPYWYDGIVPDLAGGRCVLVVAHGNSLRALMKHLEEMSDEAITEVNLPTGIPRVYRLGTDWRPLEGRYLGDPGQIEAKQAAVAAQGTRR